MFCMFAVWEDAQRPNWENPVKEVKDLTDVTS